MFLVTELAACRSCLIYRALAGLDSDAELIPIAHMTVIGLNMRRERLFFWKRAATTERTSPLAQMHLHFMIHPFSSRSVQLVWILTSSRRAYVGAQVPENMPPGRR